MFRRASGFVLADNREVTALRQLIEPPLLLSLQASLLLLGKGNDAWPNTYRQPEGVRTYVSPNQRVQSKGSPYIRPPGCLSQHCGRLCVKPGGYNFDVQQDLPRQQIECGARSTIRRRRLHRKAALTIFDPPSNFRTVDDRKGWFTKN
jgi:hypothetical protein